MSCFGELLFSFFFPPLWIFALGDERRELTLTGRADELPQNVQMVAEELIHLMTIMYMAIQVALDGSEEFADVKQRLCKFSSRFFSFTCLN